MNASPPGVSLLWLLDGIAPPPAPEAAGAARALDLTLDSRAVRNGSVFLALAGGRSHGLAFAGEAAARGASAVLFDPEGVPDELRPESGPATASLAGMPLAGMPLVPIDGLQKLAGRIADRFFGWPSAHLRVIGITGTNGKTTCAYLLAQALGRLQCAAGYMGTIGWGRLGALEAPTHTTPDVITVHRQLAQLRAQGVRDVAMEVSSHALAQGRVDGVRFQTAAFTNLTRDHLDYHGSMEQYGAAKALLFDAPDLEHRVINVGDAFGRDLALRRSQRALDGAPNRVAYRVPLTAVWVGEGGSGWLADRSLHGADVRLDLAGLSMSVDGSFGRLRVATRLLGRFNAENFVVVLACLAGLGLPFDAAAAALAACSAPPGRMEVVAVPDQPKPVAVIDYAHTPDALEKALNAAREHCRGALWCVFGCGGDRDPGKRPMMGAIADELADHIIVTDDNPRSEDPELIAAGIAQGITAHPVRIIHDRGAAIAAALAAAAPDDLVLIAGKGHEEYQIHGEVRRRFSDRQEALRILGVAA